MVDAAVATGRWTSLRPRRYGPGARFYDVLSFERPVYRAGRLAALSRLGLGPGASVLDVGCGTGLNFPALVDAVGPSGRVVGVDASPDMLAEAYQRVRRHGWTGVEVVQGDAGRLGDLGRLAGQRFDALVFAYSLGVIERWEQAWAHALAAVRLGGAVAVVDTALPTGRWRVLTPVAALALLTGGVHAGRRVWERVLEETEAPEHVVLKGGHVHVAVGRRPAAMSVG